MCFGGGRSLGGCSGAVGTGPALPGHVVVPWMPALIVISEVASLYRRQGIGASDRRGVRRASSSIQSLAITLAMWGDSCGFACRGISITRWCRPEPCMWGGRGSGCGGLPGPIRSACGSMIGRRRYASIGSGLWGSRPLLTGRGGSLRGSSWRAGAASRNRAMPTCWPTSSVDVQSVSRDGPSRCVDTAGKARVSGGPGDWCRGAALSVEINYWGFDLTASPLLSSALRLIQ